MKHSTALERKPKKRWALGLVVGFSVALAAIARQDVQLAESVDLHGAEYVTSGRCGHCHEDHYESWAATYHRTMTQEADDTSVLAPFGGEHVRYRGWEASMRREP